MKHWGGGGVVGLISQFWFLFCRFATEIWWGFRQILENGTGFAYKDRLKGEGGREGGRDGEGGGGGEGGVRLFVFIWVRLIAGRVCRGFDVKEISFGSFFGMDTKARVVYRINMLCCSVCFFGRWIFGVLIFDFDFDYLHGI